MDVMYETDMSRADWYVEGRGRSREDLRCCLCGTVLRCAGDTEWIIQSQYPKRSEAGAVAYEIGALVGRVL